MSQIMYNKYVTFEQIKDYDNNIDNDPYIDNIIKSNKVIREVCRAGLFLYESLLDLNCPPPIILKIQWLAGKLSYNKDPWEIHHSMIENYKNNSLILEEEISISPKLLN